MGINWIRHLRRTVGLIWVGVLVSLLGLVGISHLAPHTGRSIYIIRGASMSPAIPLGSLVTVTPVDASVVALDDVITVRGGNGIVYTHRVVGIDRTGGEYRFELKGDANSAPDGGLVPAANLIGRLEATLPMAGYLLAMLSLPSGVMSIMSMLGSLLLAYWVLEDLEPRPDTTETETDQVPERAPDPAAA